jgi:hypothetical protein
VVAPLGCRERGASVDRRFASRYDCLQTVTALFRTRWRILALGLVLAVAACGGGSASQISTSPTATTPTSAGGNLFGNPGFEDGRDPWFSLKPPDFLVSEDVAHSGKASAFLPFRADKDEEGNKIYYLVQEIQPKELPEVISGYYRVENWNKGTEKQYLQFVVIVFGADNLPGGYVNHQIRYLLAGINEPPFAIGNAQFVFLSLEDPPVGEWVHFERNLRDDFKKFWGAVPEDFENIRILFEVRYDDKKVGEGPLGADVYYDDMYTGPAPTTQP